MKRNVYLNSLVFEEALNLLAGEFSPSAASSTETVPVIRALGRVSGAPVFARLSNPGYNASAMDGIAVSAARTAGAGPRTPLELRAPEDFRWVDTGDPLPERFDGVIMVEDLAHAEKDRAVIHAPAHPWQNVRPVGEDMVAGEMIIPSYSRIRPVDIGALIAGGITRVEVLVPPRVGIIPTGTELVEDPDRMESGSILDSNSWMFSAQVTESGGVPVRYSPVPDDYPLLKQTVLRALEECDLVIIGAGSSAGSEDFSRALIEELGTLLFHGVSIKPGKPVIFGRARGKPLVCIPGYPVSAYIVFDRLVQPLVRSFLGQALPPGETRTGILTRPLVSSLKYLEFVRVKCGRVGDRTVVTPLSRGAGVTMSLVQADAVVEIPREFEGLEAGTEVTLHMMKPWGEISRRLVSIGSHDPLMDLLAEHMKFRPGHPGLSSTHTGSLGGVMAIRKGECHLAPVHLLEEETGGYNRHLLDRYCPGGEVVLVKGVRRVQGLMLPPGNPDGITGLQDLLRPEISFVNRQRGAGTRVLLDHLCGRLGLDREAIRGYDREMTTHMAVAQAVRSGSARTGLGVYSAARMMGLDFLPVGEEEYDFLFRREVLDTPEGRGFLEILQSETFARELESLGGYRLAGPGEIIEG